MEKTAIVTGAASGIGYEISKNLAQMGCEVHGIDIKEIRSDSVIGHICDVSNPDDVMKTVAEIVGRDTSEFYELVDGGKVAQGKGKTISVEEMETDMFYPRIDYLINAAGIIRRGMAPIWIGRNADWQDVINVNLNGTFYVSKYILPWMKASGCILNFSSEQVEKPNMKSAPYAVSKAAIELLSKIMAISCVDKGIRVNTVALGTVRTDFIKNSGLVMSDEELAKKTEQAGRMMPLGMIEISEVWELVKYLIFEANKMTGQTILMDSGLTTV